LLIAVVYKSDNNGSADDADEADLRGFCFACGKAYFATKAQRHKMKKIRTSFLIP
jgi:hypothetical protein